MLHRVWRHAVVLTCGSFLVLSGLHAPVSVRVEAQSVSAGKRPLTYDMFDAWWSIQGTTLSRDGEWLAYALTSQGLDGQLVVRNLKTGNEFKHPRGTNPNFTPDGKFVLFTIVPTKADEEKVEKEEQANRANQAQAGEGGQGRGEGQGQNRNQRNQPRNSAGIMALPTGTVTTVERVGNISLPEESSTWVALYKGNRAGAGGGGGRGGRGGRGGGGAAQAAAGRGAGQGRGDTERGAKRKDAGSDLILRNLTTGQDTTIPLVSDFAWTRDGSWITYGVSSQKAEEDGAFARQMSDGTAVPLLKGKGNYKGFTFDEAGKQAAFLSDQAEYRQASLAVSSLLLEAG